MAGADKNQSEEMKTTLTVPKRRKADGPMSKIRKRVSSNDPMAILVFETKLLFLATAMATVAIIFWTVSISTNFWFHVSAPSGGYLYLNRTNNFFVRSHSGIWTICKYMILNGTQKGPIEKLCHNHRLFPTTEFLQKNPEVDRTILDYTRTEIAFSIISFCLMIMGIGFSIYTFKQPRYMFKRLAGVVHFISAGAILVVVEVVVNSVKYEEHYLTDRHPKGAEWSYGYSFIIAWVTFVILILSGAIFIYCSRKKKGDRAIVNAGADEPHIIGRV